MVLNAAPRLPLRKLLRPLEKWGGAECSVNRVGDAFFDQIEKTGHHRRDGDIALMADLDLQRVRFPILWERVKTHVDCAPDWRWTDNRLSLLKANDIRPIAGLLHHGSGPLGTSLIDGGFASSLASFAAQAAERYPWILDWTPVNEPLTTARFSALYGLWYPHLRNEAAFWEALLNQIDATRLAMKAIRVVQPHARLVQTEDLGRTYATAGLADQAAFDNQRRWLTWDLLCGMVGPSHPMWPRLSAFGLEPRLRTILADPCPPDILGIDHYLTSDRLLDERIERYPAETCGGNSSDVYSDVEAVRVLNPTPQGLNGALRETWARYGRPIAITEVHNGCTREEQVRWFNEAWSTARQARADGIEVCAVTAWALFGSSGWNTLLTEKGEYEAGAFDVSSGEPRRTALADAVKNAGPSSLPVGGSGWWRRQSRLLYPAALRPAPMAEHPRAERRRIRQQDCPVLIVGATGTLGGALAAECRHRDVAYRLTGRDTLDLLDRDSVARVLEEVRPWGVVNAAGWVRVDEAEDQPAACHAANATGALHLANACAERGIPTLGFSSDLVFDGEAGLACLEQDQTCPLNVYGLSKARMEAGVAAIPGKHMIVRTAAFFSPFDSHNFAVQCLRAMRAGETFDVADDCTISPTYVPDLCRTALDLLFDGEAGLWHLTNGEAVTWLEFARRLCAAAGVDDRLLAGRNQSQMGWRAARPSFAPLASARGQLLPTLDSAITRFVAVQSAGSLLGS